MATSEARIQANRRNSLLSTGPTSEQGRAVARANSLKHGMTGAGVVIAEVDAAEVERRTGTFAAELQASGDVGMSLARRAALNSVRMERGADQQTAALTERVRQVEADFVAPEGVDEAEAAQLKSEAVRAAMFDPSKEACLARQYEAAAERNFFRCLKELDKLARTPRVEAPSVPAKPASITPPPPVVKSPAAPTPVAKVPVLADRESSLPDFEVALASFLEAERMDAVTDGFFAEIGKKLPPMPANSPFFVPVTEQNKVPVAIGRRR